MIIEKLRKKDMNEYKALIDEAFGSSNDIAEYDKYSEEDMNYEIIVLKEKEKIVGTVTMYKINLFTFSFQPVIELFNVAIKKEYRRQNLGRILLNYVIDYAKENGYHSINLTCLECEKDVHKFYEAVGFVKADSRKYKMSL